MYAAHIRTLMVFAVIVTVVVMLATSALPAHAETGDGGVTVAVRVARRVSLSLPAPGQSASDTPALANVECQTSAQWVVRDGSPVWLVTVVPSR